MNVLSILNRVAATASKNDKVAILKENASNAGLKEAFRLAYDKSIRFWIRDLRAHGIDSSHTKEWMNLTAAFDAVLTNVSTRLLTGDTARMFLGRIAGSLVEEDQEVFLRVLERDLKVGATDGTANKVWEGLVPVHDVMLCNNDVSRIVYPAYSQKKEDGGRGHLIINPLGQAVLLSRPGNEIELQGVFDTDARAIVGTRQLAKSYTLDGEVIFYKDGVALDRKTSNGLFNKAVKGTITKEEAEGMRFIAWDLVEENQPYSARWYWLLTLLSDAGRLQRIQMVDTMIVNSYEEALDHFKKIRREGGEGTILKNAKSKWVPKRSKDLCKLKAIYEVDLKVIGFNYGAARSKYDGMLGALVCTDADDRIQVDVGTGLSDEQRKSWTPESIVGKIVTIEYNERIKSKTDKKESMFLPRLTQLRLDKTQANTYNEILETEAAAIK